MLSSAGLYVDYESIFGQLSRFQAGFAGHEAVARRLVELARSVGQLRQLQAWADWDRVPGAQRIFATQHYDTRFVPGGEGGRSASDAMRLELLRQLDEPFSPQIWVISCAPDGLSSFLDTLRQRRRRIIFVGLEEGLPGELRQKVSGFLPLLPEEFVDEETPVPSMPLPTPSLSVASDSDEGLDGVRQSLTRLLQDRQLPWVSYRLLVGHLVDAGFARAESVHELIQKAVQTGHLLREEEQNALKRYYRFSPGPGPQVASRQALPTRPPLPSGTLEAAPAENLRPFANRTVGWGQDWRNFTFVKLVWIYLEKREDQENSALPASTLMVALRERELGASDEEVGFWIAQAVDRGILTREFREQDGSRVLYYLPSRRSRLVVLAEEVPRAILTTLDGVLNRRPEWSGIAFNFLIRLLLVHPVLARPQLDCTPQRLREWLNFLLDEGLLRRFEEPDLKEPSRATTMVTLQRSHPLTQYFLQRGTESPFYTPEHQALLRTLLTIDHFLHWLRARSPDEDWLPLMTLKSWQRVALGDQLTKWAIAECERDRYFIVSRFQNRDGLESTVAGVRLDYNQPLTGELLRRRDEFLRLLLSLLRNRAAVPYEALESCLLSQPGLGRTQDERLAWLSLMADSRVILIEREGSGADDGGRSLVIRLNTREKFVGELLSRVTRDSNQGGTRAEPSGETPRASGEAPSFASWGTAIPGSPFSSGEPTDLAGDAEASGESLVEEASEPAASGPDRPAPRSLFDVIEGISKRTTKRAEAASARSTALRPGISRSSSDEV